MSQNASPESATVNSHAADSAEDGGGDTSAASESVRQRPNPMVCLLVKLSGLLVMELEDEVELMM